MYSAHAHTNVYMYMYMHITDIIYCTYTMNTMYTITIYMSEVDHK